MNNYTIMHLHTDKSSCVTSIDSVTKFDQYIARAKECGMKALGFSEHGSVFGWVKKKECIEAAGMKYIHGEEFYITKTLDEKIRDNNHCILIAKNYDGVLELNRLSSVAFNRNDNHFYYMPRISLDELINTSDNIIISTACLASPLHSDDDEMKQKFLDFVINNKNRCFLEIQHHDVQEQKDYNLFLYDLSQKYDLPLITGTDTHALNDEHMEARAVMQKAKNVRFENEDSWDLTFKTYDELVEVYRKQDCLPMDVVLKAIENTNRLADMIEEFELDRSYKYPHLWDNPEELFMEKIKAGIKKRGVHKYPNRQEYADRIQYELKAYKHNQAIDFMLLMEDIISWCREQDIQVGYGRGSVNGSVIAWLLGITEMDSIKHKLNFDRFLNVERVSLSDVDTDIPPSRIEDVKQYLFNKHGLHCCDIITFNTIADKGAVRDVGRALSIPLDEVSRICDAIDGGDDSYSKVRLEYPELFKYVDLVKGVIVSYGNHPCGTVVCESTLDDAFGLCSSTTDPYPISQIYMKEIDGLNYVKLDLLKLDTIELIYNTCKMAGIPMITPDNLDINDDEVWASIRDDTTQIFQWEGSTGEQYIKRLFRKENINKFKKIDKNFNQMTLMSIGNSAIRPAGASYREELARGEIRTTGSEAIDDFLKDTAGYLCFQEQIIFFLHLYCGFTMGEADVVRRGFAKKTGTEQYIPIIKDGGYLKENHHIDGFIKTMKDKYDIPEEKSEKDITAFLRVIEDASSYLFSLNHSQPYSYMGYASGWLRYYYPVEFCTCALNIVEGDQNRTNGLIGYMKKRNISLEPIKFRYSKGVYSGDVATNKIYKGIGSIKHLSRQLADELYELRDVEYGDFVDLLCDIEKTSCDSRQLDILIKLDFFSEFGDINLLLKTVEIFNRVYGRKQIKLADLAKLEIPLRVIQSLAKTQTPKMFKDFDSLELVKDLCKDIDVPEARKIEKMMYEREYLGYIATTIPEANINNYVVTGIDGKYKNKRLTLYRIVNGEERNIKVKGASLKEKPLEVGDVIHVREIENARKWSKDADGNWIKLEERELIIKKYDVMKK